VTAQPARKCVVCASPQIAAGETYYCADHVELQPLPRGVSKGRNALTSLTASRSPRSSFLVPCPQDDDLGAVEWLLREHDAGRREPKPVRLKLPGGATREEILVAEFFERLHGLRLTTRLPEPVPFAVRWVAVKTGLTRRMAHDAIVHLRDDGVIRLAGSLERPGGWPRGTNLYLPGGLRVIDGGAG
jgi:hypothetical protein